VVQQFKNDPVLSKVTAVENDRVAPGPVWEIGPVVNFFNTEILAKALYPDQFGEYVEFEEPPDDEKLFDRQHLANIIQENV
jgi:iron complex transport system substrate-binding protein